jgi:hypothetical protein
MRPAVAPVAMTNGAVLGIAFPDCLVSGERGVPSEHRAEKNKGNESATFQGPCTHVRYKPRFLLVHVENMLASQAGFLRLIAELDLI